MKQKVLLLALCAAAVLACRPVTAADSGADVVKANGCLNCHDSTEKKVGPSFKEIAVKNKNAAPLVAKLKDGKGHMKIDASDAEIKSAVDYVLATK